VQVTPVASLDAPVRLVIRDLAMSPAARRYGWRYAGAAFAALMLCVSTGRAQDVTEPSLKAAFIYTFAKFTEWPEDILPTTATFSACVLGDSQIREALERTVKGRQFEGRGINVSQVQLAGKLRSCHLLYVSGVTPAQVTAIVLAVRGAPVLTISDIDDFAELGGIAQMFVENGKMHFDLNLGVAKVSRLQLSSKLLVLAAHVHDRPKAVGP
jgi:YfiR/HmsC-like